MIKTLFLILALAAASAQAWGQGESTSRAVVLDEDAWVVFYDVPSRRFRTIRSDFVKREFASASNDLMTSARYLLIEADRASPEISARLSQTADRLVWIAENIDDVEVTGAELDSQFGRAHWLLAQHYLENARQLRDLGQLRRAGQYLWATTHHLERAVLWSNARIDRKLHATLESLRDLAVRLQDPARAQKALNDRPIVKAENFLRELGRLIDRPVVMAESG